MVINEINNPLLLLVNDALVLKVCVVATPLSARLIKNKQIIIIRNYCNYLKYGISLKRIKEALEIMYKNKNEEF